jgi:histidinol phosphatase-like enzyme
VSLAGFYYCPHHPSGNVPPYSVECTCRKPRPGLLQRAAYELALDLEASWMIGDILDDVEAGHRAGCRSILMDNGGETEWDLRGPRSPAALVPNLVDAATHILSSPRRADAASGQKGQSCLT